MSLSYLASAQDYLVNLRHLTVKDGLSSDRVRSLHQDQQGFMWLGTEYGLNRFDGHEFKWFTKEHHGIESNYITQIVEDGAGWLWIKYRVASDRDYSKYAYKCGLIHSQTFEIQSLEEQFPNNKFPQTGIKDLFEVSKGRILIVFKNGEKWLYNTQNKFVQLNVDAQLRIVNVSNNQIIGQIEKKLITTDLNGKILTSISLPPNLFVEQVIAHKKHLFLKTKSEEDKNPHRIIVYKDTALINQMIWTASNNLTLFYNPAFKSVAILSHKGIWKINSALDVELIIDNYLKPKFIFTTLVDNNNVIWGARRDGVHLIQFQPSKFQKIVFNQQDEQNSKFMIRGLAKVDSLLFLIPKSAILHSIEENDGIFVQKSKPHFLSHSLQLFQGSNDGFWTLKDYKITKIDKNGQVLEIASPSIDERAWSLYRDKSGTFWIDAITKQLLYFNKKKHTSIQIFNQVNGHQVLLESRINQFFEDEYGLWMVTDNGLFLHQAQKGIVAMYGKEATDDKWFPSSNFNHLHKDKKGNYWLATGDIGLLKLKILENEPIPKFKHQIITRREGLPSNELYAILEDDFNNLWISTSRGLVRFDKTNLSSTIYLEEDGITLNEFNRLSYCKSDDGQFFFGSQNGVTTFYPKHFHNQSAYDVDLKLSLAQKAVASQDTILDITASVLEKNKIVFSNDLQYISLQISLQDFIFSDKTKYSYRIKDVQDNWTEITDNNLIITSIPYGRYDLEIRGKPINNTFSTKTIELDLVRPKPFYLTIWFFILVIGGIGFTIWWYNRRRVLKLQERQKELEQLVAVRTQQLEKDKTIIEGQAQELKKLDELKSRFFANVSHELRTPLTLILSPIRTMLKSKKLDTSSQKYASIVEQNAKTLLKQINSILDLTKLEANKLELNPIPTTIHPFIQRLMANFESVADIKKIKLHLDFQLSKPLTILIDQEKFEHIFNNYLSNALKYTSKGGEIEIKVSDTSNISSLSRSQFGNTYFRLTVKDNGRGVHPDDLPYIFNRFYQAKHAKAEGGTGIGLAFSKELAELMKGKVGVKSEFGKGSTFYFEMPCQLTVGSEELAMGSQQLSVNSQQFVEMDSLQEDLEYQNEQPTILVVEDNPQLREYIQLILQEKYNIITAENGKEALNQLAGDRGQLAGDTNQLPTASEATANCQLIISDLMMPEMDGYELLTHLKSDEKYKHIPVIMLTARAAIDDKLKALRIGVDDYLTKPFVEEELIARIGNLLQNVNNRQDASKDEAIIEGKKDEIPKDMQEWLIELEAAILKNIDNSSYSVEQLSYDMAIGNRQLLRRIKLYIGMTATQYIRTVRLTKAREFLQNGRYSAVKSVSYAVGFRDVKYFSRHFKKEFGRLPSEYF